MELSSFYRYTLENLAWALIPGHCLLCDLPSGRRLDLCEHCSADLPWLKPACYCCALPLGTSNHLRDRSDRVVCGACFSRSPPFSRTVCPWHFTGEIGAWIGSVKHGQATAPIRVLGELFVRHLLHRRLDTPMPDALVPVPLSNRRLLWRGHNQAESFAQQIGGRLGIPIRSLLRRARHSRPQQGLSRAARLRNVAGVFESARVDGLRLAIVDDVMTTGATLRQATRCLLRAGASEVELWCIARAGASP